MEKWLPIKEYEDLYEVSNLGRVRSLPRLRPYKDSYRKVEGRLLKQNLRGDKTKYLYVTLSKDGISKKYKVHQLVLNNFTKKTSNIFIVRHKDDNPLNNNINNLEWGTISDNTKDKFNNGYRHHAIKLSDVEIMEVLQDNVHSQRELANIYDVSQKCIFNIKNKEGYYGKF